MTQESCILEQFGHFAELSDDDERLLISLEQDPRVYGARSVICENGSNARGFFTVRRGWAYATRILADGQRQVLDIFLPGQIMGLREIGFNRSLSDFVALTEVEACPFPRSRLSRVFEASPRLAELFMLVLAREQSMLTERIINIGRRPAAERLAHFVLEMKVRLNQSRHEFELPMNQAIIGDALGLSSVHVSRTLAQLRRDGLVCIENGQVTIRDMDGLVAFAEFNPAYLDSHSNWTLADCK